MIANLLLPQSDSDHLTIMDQTAGLAAATDARVEVVTVLPDPMQAAVLVGPTFGAAIGPSAIDAVNAAQAETVQKMKLKFDAAFGDNASARFSSLVGLPEMLIPPQSVLADLTLFSQDDACGESQLAGCFERVLMDARQPVAIVGHEPVNWGGKIGLAWDGGPEAIHAFKAAFPLIKDRGELVVLQGTRHIEEVHADAAREDQLRPYLERKGISVEWVSFDGSPSKDLVSTAEANDLSILVAGAYGHSRTREFFFGGATRSMLKAESGMAMILAH